MYFLSCSGTRKKVPKKEKAEAGTILVPGGREFSRRWRTSPACGGTTFFLVREQERTKEKAEADEILSSGVSQGGCSRRRRTSLFSEKLHCPATSLAARQTSPATVERKETISRSIPSVTSAEHAAPPPLTKGRHKGSAAPLYNLSIAE